MHKTIRAAVAALTIAAGVAAIGAAPAAADTALTCTGPGQALAPTVIPPQTATNNPTPHIGLIEVPGWTHGDGLVAIRGTDNTVRVRHFYIETGWSDQPGTQGWRNLGGNVTSAVKVAPILVDLPGSSPHMWHLQVVAVGTDGGTWRRIFDQLNPGGSGTNTWTAWERVDVDSSTYFATSGPVAVDWIVNYAGTWLTYTLHVQEFWTAPIYRCTWRVGT